MVNCTWISIWFSADSSAVKSKYILLIPTLVWSTDQHNYWLWPAAALDSSHDTYIHTWMRLTGFICNTFSVVMVFSLVKVHPSKVCVCVWCCIYMTKVIFNAMRISGIAPSLSELVLFPYDKWACLACMWDVHGMLCTTHWSNSSRSEYGHEKWLGDDCFNDSGWKRRKRHKIDKIDHIW